MAKEYLLDVRAVEINEKWFMIKLFNEFDNWATIDNILMFNQEHKDDKEELIPGFYSGEIDFEGDKEPYYYEIERLNSDSTNSLLSNSKFDTTLINGDEMEKLMSIGFLISSKTLFQKKEAWMNLEKYKFDTETLLKFVNQFGVIENVCGHRYAGLDEYSGQGMYDALEIFEDNKESYEMYESFLYRKVCYNTENQERLSWLVNWIDIEIEGALTQDEKNDLIEKIRNSELKFEWALYNTSINDWIPYGNGASDAYYESLDFRLKEFDGTFTLEVSTHKDSQWSLTFYPGE